MPIYFKVLLVGENNDKKIFDTFICTTYRGGTLSGVTIKFVENPKLLKNLSGTIGQLALVEQNGKVYRFIYNGKKWLPLTQEPFISGEVDFFGDGSGVALYTLDKTTKDSGGNYDAIGNNISYTRGKFGYAVNFINSDPSSYIKTMRKIRRNNKDITISGWIYVVGHTGKWLTIWHLSPNDSRLNYGREPALWMHENDNSRFHIRNDSSYNNSDGIDISSGKITYNHWHHIVQVVTTNQMRFYIDGVLTDTLSRSRFYKNDGYFYIGDRWANKNHLIDQVRIFNRALNQSEINRLYHEGE